MVSPRRTERNENTDSKPETVAPQQKMEDPDHLIRPKRLSNPFLESSSHRVLHRELRVSHRWDGINKEGKIYFYGTSLTGKGRFSNIWITKGLLPAEKCELQRVMEQRRLEQQREREQAQRPLTDLEQELSKRRQRLLTYELEEQKRREDLKNVPEFVRVKDNLRRVCVS